MANKKEIQDRMNGIRDTLKITNAMYLISSSKLRKARKNWQMVSDYFETIRGTMEDILAHMPDMEHVYLESDTKKKEGRRAYIVITADKGLAGAYNLNVIKKVEHELEKDKDALLFVVGQMGRHHFESKKKNIVKDFYYSSENPSMQRARNITVEVLDYFLGGEIDEVFLVFTAMKNALQSEAMMKRLLPLSREDFTTGLEKWEKEKMIDTVSFFPDPASVFGQVAPISMHGLIFSALTESYCAELNDRMTAMSGASKSARDMLDELELEYNRSRQYGITQEITEVSAGSKAQKKKKIS
jgi:F-type H+-transporting ATPase subunit gamma